MTKFNQQEKDAAIQLINNMNMVEDITHLTNKTQDFIFSKIDEAIDAWCKSQDLYFENGYEKSKPIWFGEEEWIVNKIRSQAYAWYELNRNDDSTFWLSDLTGSSQIKTKFFFRLDPMLMPNKIKNNSTWKSFVKKFNDEHTEIEQAGIIFDPNYAYWSVDFSIEPQILAEAFINNNVMDALDPLIEAIEKIFSMNGLFKQLIAQAQDNFK